MSKVVLLFALAFSSAIFANNFSKPTDLKTGSITGKVFDRTLQEPVAYATIVVKSIEDASNITGTHYQR